MSRFRRAFLLSIVAYTLVAVIWTYPLAFNLAAAVAGDETIGDSLQYTWFVWWGKTSLLDLGLTPAQLEIICHPFGLYHPLLLIEPFYSQVCAIPLVSLFGPVAAYNVQLLLAFILSAAFACLLCYYLTGNVWAAFVGGLIFGFFPNKTNQALVGHMPLTTMYWWPLYALYLIRLFDKPGVRNGLLCGLFMSLSIFVTLTHIAYFVIPFTLIFVVYRLWTGRRRLLNARLLKGVGAALLVVGLITIGPFSNFVLNTFLDPASDFPGQKEGTLDFSATPELFLTPSPYHPLLGKIEPFRAYSYGLMAEGLTENMVYLGVVPLLLAIWGVRKNRARSTVWWILALGSAILSLGPVLKIGDRVVQVGGHPIPLPYALLQGIPFIGWSRTPARWNESTMFALAVLACYGVSSLTTRFSNSMQATESAEKEVFSSVPSVSSAANRPGLRAGLMAGLTALILFEYAVIFPFPLGGEYVSPFYRQIAADKRDFALLDMPLAGVGPKVNAILYYQMTHRHRLVGGHVTRIPRWTRDVRRFFEQLVAPTLADDIVVRPPDVARPANLGLHDIGYVVFQRRFYNEEEMGAYLALLVPALGEPIFQDEQIIAFSAPILSAEAWEEVPLVMFDGKWHGVEHDDESPGEAARWLSDDGLLAVYCLTPGEMRLGFAASSFLFPRRLRVAINNALVGEFRVGPWRRYLTDRFRVKSGWNYVYFDVEEGCERPVDSIKDSQDARCLSLRFQEVAFLRAGTENIPHPLNVRLGDKIELRGYALGREEASAGQALGLTLFWEANTDLTGFENLSGLGENYTVFTHLLDAEGQMLAQDDSQPMRGFYPTAEWKKGEVVRDQHVLLIPPKAPAGQYSVEVGMYLAATGARLPLVDEAGHPIGDSIPLGKINVQ